MARERIRGWRPVILGWAACALLPLVACALVVAMETSLAWPWRVVVVLGGTAGTAAMTWLAGCRAMGTLGDGFDVLRALREGDYGTRATLRPGHDALQPLLADINELSDALQKLRRQSTESSRFLGKSLAALSDPVFVIDGDDQLLLANTAARTLIGAGRTPLVGRDLASLDLAEPLAAADGAILAWHFATGHGRWSVRRASLYSNGRKNTLVMLQNLDAALGDEERNAWQRLIRVLNHELNNSLTPIGSLATSLFDMLDAGEPEALKDELRLGLEVIARRSAALARFLGGYGRLARLPPPRLQPVRLDMALQRLARLEERLPIVIEGTEAVTVSADGDQLDQAFLNLMRNAVEAVLPRPGQVRVFWKRDGSHVTIRIEDEGCGLPTSDTLFVPFFTTKPGGSGIGLSLTRMIVDAHAGSVVLENRADGPGAVATVRLPVTR